MSGRFCPRSVLWSGFMFLLALPGLPACHARDTATAVTRKPAVSGQFYPADPKILKSKIRGFLSKASSKPAPGIRALVVPHAGYAYSGQIAAEAYNTVKGRKFDSVIILGFSHQAEFKGVFVDRADAYETPLGIVPVNQTIAGEIRDFHELLRDAPPGKFTEHSVEVQVPFLQETLQDLNIVPVFMGRQTPENVRVLAEALSRVMANRNVLLVVSTDLSHYYPYDTAVQKDTLLISLVEKSDMPALATAYDQGRVEACGFGPVLTLLLLQKKMGWQNPHLIRYANSGDVTGDRRKVVGYAAMRLKDSSELSDEQKKGLLQYVRSYLEAYYHHAGREPELKVASPILHQKRGVFVTLKKHGRLRGCVGQITTNKPVREGLGYAALSAALHDGRFNPVSAAELGELEIHISILTPLREVDSYRDIRLGKDGIVVEAAGRSGVFLPEVASETGWDRETFFRHCALDKAGLRPDQLDQAKIYVFQSEAFGEDEFR